MAKYEYETVEVETSLWSNEPKGLEKVLNDYASKGWRLVHMLSPTWGGMAKYILVFERESGRA
jgi:hypothetical protein